MKRFEEIISKITEKKISIVDVGCGYGALYQYLLNMRLLDRFDYEGVDINSDFIKSCKQKYPQINFFVSNKPKKIVDYVVMSGTYNLATLNDVIFWEKYIFQNLVECFELCKTGLIFNMHVNNFTTIRNKIFYTTEKRMTSLLSNITKNIRFYKSDHFKNERIFFISR